MLNPVKLKKYMRVAEAVASLSKDESTKVGAVLIGPDGEGGPWGYNGAPRGSSIDDRQSEISRETKRAFFEHAERNAIFSAARSGTKTDGMSLVVTHFPCAECARAIIQAGIRQVVCKSPAEGFAERWAESIALSRQMLAECDVDVIEIEIA